MAPSRPPLPEPLTSARSATVARLRRLHDRKGRQQSGTFLAEGPDCVRAALEGGSALEVVCVPEHPLIAQAQQMGVRVTLAVPRVVDAAADTRTSQGILAECRLPLLAPAEVLDRMGPVVIADRLADPGNLGTIVRTAEAVGAAGLLMTPGSVDPWNPKSVRASAGSILRLPVAQATDATEVITDVHDSGRTVIALSGNSSKDVFDLLARLPESADQLAWIVGSEAHGVASDLAVAADHVARVPMAATVESLNAAVALAICLYSARTAR